MLAYPAIVPEAGRARIALVIRQADAAFQAVKLASVLPDGDGGFGYRADDAPLWDVAAVEGLVCVADAIHEELL